MATAPVIISPLVGEYTTGTIQGNGEGSLPERQCVQALAGLVLSFPAVSVTGAGSNVTTDWNIANLISNGFSRLQAVLAVSAAGAAAGDTLDVLIDVSPDNGTTWFNVAHFNQALGNGGAVSYVARTPSAASGSVSNVTADQAAGNAGVPFAGNAIRVRRTTVSASAAAFTFGVTVTLLP